MITTLSTPNDLDGDGVTNDVEERFNSNQHDFFSAPPAIFSRLTIFLFLILSAIILASMILTYIFLKRYYKEEQEKFGAPDVETMNRVKKNGFTSYTQYERAQIVGVTNKSDLDLIERYKAPDLKIAKIILSGGYSDFQSYQKAQQLGALSINEFHAVKSGYKSGYNNREIETNTQVLIKQYPNYTTYLWGLEAGAPSYTAYKLMAKYNAPDYASAKQKFLIDMKNELNEFGKTRYLWKFEDLKNYLGIPIDQIHTLLIDLLNHNYIQGSIDTNKNEFMSTKISSDDMSKVNNYISKIRAEIPITMDQMSSVTGIEKFVLKKIIETITQGENPAGEYLPLEGVFIKNVGFVRAKIGEYTCFYCGAILDKGTKTCPSCEQAVNNCEICKQPINFGEESGGCLYCGNNNFHYRHLAETVKVTGECPICKEALTEVDITVHQSGKSKK